jgi:hypothetical protein
LKVDIFEALQLLKGAYRNGTIAADQEAAAHDDVDDDAE